MSILNPRRPREFHHRFIYVDERKERLKEIEERAKRELGLMPEKEISPEELRGTFTGALKHVQRRKQKERVGRKPFGIGILIFLIIALAALWYYLAR